MHRHGAYVWRAERNQVSHPTRDVLPLASVCRLSDGNYLYLYSVDNVRYAYAARALQLHHNGGQFGFRRSSARTPHGAYV